MYKAPKKQPSMEQKLLQTYHTLASPMIRTHTSHRKLSGKKCMSCNCTSDQIVLQRHSASETTKSRGCCSRAFASALASTRSTETQALLSQQRTLIVATLLLTRCTADAVGKMRSSLVAMHICTRKCIQVLDRCTRMHDSGMPSVQYSAILDTGH